MIKAEDLRPLLAKMTGEERLRLARLALAEKILPPDASDAERYQAMPVHIEEFTNEDEEDAMAWESEGWEDVK